MNKPGPNKGKFYVYLRSVARLTSHSGGICDANKGRVFYTGQLAQVTTGAKAGKLREVNLEYKCGLFKPETIMYSPRYRTEREGEDGEIR